MYINHFHPKNLVPLQGLLQDFRNLNWVLLLLRKLRDPLDWIHLVLKIIHQQQVIQAELFSISFCSFYVFLFREHFHQCQIHPVWSSNSFILTFFIWFLQPIKLVHLLPLYIYLPRVFVLFLMTKFPHFCFRWVKAIFEFFSYSLKKGCLFLFVSIL